MPIDWSPFVEFVNSHQRFLIMTHVRPDGDALGSEIGLACALRQLGKSARVAIASDLGPRYEFANSETTPIERFQAPGDAFRNVDAIIVVDSDQWIGQGIDDGAGERRGRGFLMQRHRHQAASRRAQSA